MPQTHEHLAVLDLLEIRHGVIVLSKIDTVDDPDWLELVEQEIRQLIQNTTLSAAEIVHVSAVDGTGIQELLNALTSLLADVPQRPDDHRPRLPIDRVFSVSGFGTVVTGTLIEGSLHVGDEIEIQPTGLHGRIRGLQNHKQPVEVARPGGRVAVNITGIERTAIARGNVLLLPDSIRPTTLIDVRFRTLQSISKPLHHNAEVKFFSGTAKTNGKIRLLTSEILPPGTEGWLQILLKTPQALSYGDRFILRYPSPDETIGGGIVLNPHPGKRWRRFQSEVIAQLEIQMLGTPAERIAQAASKSEPIRQQELEKEVGYTNAHLDSAIVDALNEGLLVQFRDGAYLSTVRWKEIQRHMIRELRKFHEIAPLRLGMLREEFRSRMGLKNTTLTILLEAQDEIVVEGNLLRLKNHQIRFTSAQSQAVERLMQEMTASSFTPPSYTNAVQIVGEDILHAMIDLGELVRVQPDIIFSRQVYEKMVSTVLQIIDTTGSISVSALRDHFDTTRKYAIGLLEYLDTIGVTRRVGDTRIRGQRTDYS